MQLHNEGRALFKDHVNVLEVRLHNFSIGFTIKSGQGNLLRNT